MSTPKRGSTICLPLLKAFTVDDPAASLCTQYFMLKRFVELVDAAPEEEGQRSICTRLGSLYALWSIQKYTGTLYQGKSYKRSTELGHICIGPYSRSVGNIMMSLVGCFRRLFYSTTGHQTDQGLHCHLLFTGAELHSLSPDPILLVC